MTSENVYTEIVAERGAKVIPDLLRGNAGNVGEIGALLDLSADEIDRLRAEVQHLRTGWITLQIDIGDLIPAIDGERANDPMINRVKRVVTELAEARKPDCLRCRRYHRHGFGEGVCANTLIGEPACINGDGFREDAPVRLYEKEEK